MLEINSPDEINDFCERILSIFLGMINSLSSEIGSDITLDFLSNISVKFSRCIYHYGIILYINLFGMGIKLSKIMKLI